MKDACGRPKKIWSEVVEDFWTQEINEDAMDHSKWRKFNN